MNKKTKEILLSILKAILIIVIVGLLSMFFINQQEKKKEENKKKPSQTTQINSEETETTESSETDEPPEYEINERLLEYENFKYYVKEGKAYIAGYIGEDKTTISIPRKIANYDVVGFTEGVCWYNEDLKKVIIEEGIKEIPINAFIGCKNLTEVKFPVSLTTISSNAFKGCESLKSLYISRNITTIADTAFVGLTSLEEITISVDNPNFIVENNVLYNKEKNKVLKVFGNMDTITFPNTVREIGSYSFAENTTIKEVVFPSSLSTICEFAFYNCTGIETINITKNLQKIEYGAFYGCSNLKAFEMTMGNKSFWVIDGVLYDYEMETLIAVPPAMETSIFALNSTVKYIEPYAFIDAKINTIIIPSTIQRISPYAFIGSENTEIQIQMDESMFSRIANNNWNKLFKGKIEYTK